jgi:biopolymer transport protein ExbD
LSAVSEINLTNMIDLGFVLLIIFMISTPLIEKEASIGVQLPVAANQPQRDRQDEFLDVLVDIQGRIQAGGRVVSDAEFAAILEAEARRSRPRVINVRADFRLQYQRVVSILDAVKAAGLSRISLETRPE